MVSTSKRYQDLRPLISSIDYHLINEFVTKCENYGMMQNEYKILLIIGSTGQGKSSLANSLCRKNHFKTSSGLASETSKVNCLVTNFNGDPKKPKVIIIDNPGLGDSQNRDTKHIQQTINVVKNIGYVHNFLIVINSQSPRFDEQLQTTIQLYIDMFSEKFFSNVQVCLTRFRTDQNSI